MHAKVGSYINSGDNITTLRDLTELEIDFTVPAPLAMAGMQIREFPEIERSVVTVSTKYHGASAGTVEGFVTAPLHSHIAGARGVEYMTATSEPSYSEISVHVKLGENSSEVLSEVIAKIGESRSELPGDIEEPIVSTAVGGDALMYLAFSSRQVSLGQVTDYLLRNVQPELAILDGVGSARERAASAR